MVTVCNRSRSPVLRSPLGMSLGIALCPVHSILSMHTSLRSSCSATQLSPLPLWLSRCMVSTTFQTVTETYAAVLGWNS